MGHGVQASHTRGSMVAEAAHSLAPTLQACDAATLRPWTWPTCNSARLHPIPWATQAIPRQDWIKRTTLQMGTPQIEPYNNTRTVSCAYRTPVLVPHPAARVAVAGEQPQPRAALLLVEDFPPRLSPRAGNQEKGRAGRLAFALARVNSALRTLRLCHRSCSVEAQAD